MVTAIKKAGTEAGMAQWYMATTTYCGPADDHLRDPILQQIVRSATAWTVRGNVVLVRIPSGRVRITTKAAAGIAEFTFVSNSRWERIDFVMNLTSIKFIGEALRSQSSKRVEFGSIMYQV